MLCISNFFLSFFLFKKNIYKICLCSDNLPPWLLKLSKLDLAGLPVENI